MSQSWLERTGLGEIVLDLSQCNDQNAALAWGRNEYLPEYCRFLGVAVPADNPASAPVTKIQVFPCETLPDGNVKIRFSLVE